MPHGSRSKSIISYQHGGHLNHLRYSSSTRSACGSLASERTKLRAIQRGPPCRSANHIISRVSKRTRPQSVTCLIPIGTISWRVRSICSAWGNLSSKVSYWRLGTTPSRRMTTSPWSMSALVSEFIWYVYHPDILKVHSFAGLIHSTASPFAAQLMRFNSTRTPPLTRRNPGQCLVRFQQPSARTSLSITGKLSFIPLVSFLFLTLENGG